MPASLISKTSCIKTSVENEAWWPLELMILTPLKDPSHMKLYPRTQLNSNLLMNPKNSQLQNSWTTML